MGDDRAGHIYKNLSLRICKIVWYERLRLEVLENTRMLDVSHMNVNTAASE